MGRCNTFNSVVVKLKGAGVQGVKMRENNNCLITTKYIRMKKWFTLLLLSFLVNLSSYAQIQRKFYDFTLGVTTEREFVSYFKAKEIEVEKKDDSYYIENLKFGGEEWSLSCFRFYNDKLLSVSYSENEVNKGRALLDQRWEKINSLIFRKYAGLKDLDRSSEERQLYDDSFTSLTITYHYFDGVKFLAISYSDIKLTIEKIKEEENEF